MFCNIRCCESFHEVFKCWLLQGSVATSQCGLIFSCNQNTSLLRDWVRGALPSSRAAGGGAGGMRGGGGGGGEEGEGGEGGKAR